MIFLVILNFGTACNNQNSTQHTVENAPIQKEVFRHSLIRQQENIESLRPPEVAKGQMIVFRFENKDQTFVDANDYDARLKETLLFEINPKLEKFEFTDDELLNINCRYHWVFYSKQPKGKTVDIDKGKIKGEKLDSLTWEISIDIDTEQKFGGYLDKKNSRKFNLSKKIKTVPNNG